MWFQRYLERYCGPRQIRRSDGKIITKHDGATHLDELEHKLRTTVLMRRLKRDVLRELPAIERVTIPLTPDTQASDAYDKYLAATKAFKRGNYAHDNPNELTWAYLSGDTDTTTILAEAENLDADETELSARDQWALCTLSQIRSEVSSLFSSGPAAECLRWLSRARQLAGQAKLMTIIEHARALVGAGEKVVIVAHHQAILRPLLREFRGEHAVIIDGAVPPHKRLAIVDKFQQSPDIFVCLLAMQAGGVGLTLTAAAHLIFAELAWTPAEMQQAEGRIHRLGQTRQVKTYWFVLEKSSDEHVMRLVTKKGRITIDALGDHTTGSRARLRAQAWRAAHPDRVRQQKRQYRYQRRNPSSSESAPIGPVRRGRPPKSPNQTPADIRARARERALAWNLAHRDRVREIKRAYRKRQRGGLPDPFGEPGSLC
jgi:hypothetical protein